MSNTTGSLAGDHLRPLFRARLCKYAICAALMLIGAFAGAQLTPGTLPFIAHVILMAPSMAFSLWYGIVVLHDLLVILFGPG